MAMLTFTFYSHVGKDAHWYEANRVTIVGTGRIYMVDWKKKKQKKKKKG
jgi:hypothetical protein